VNASKNIERVAKAAFEAYGLSTGGKTWDGKDIPQWEFIGEKIQAAWRAAALAVVRDVEAEYNLLGVEDP
jgi:hypothetical protein